MLHLNLELWLSINKQINNYIQTCCLGIQVELVVNVASLILTFFFVLKFFKQTLM
jgi:hypothetical protein